MVESSSFPELDVPELLLEVPQEAKERRLNAIIPTNPARLSDFIFITPFTSNFRKGFLINNGIFASGSKNRTSGLKANVSGMKNRMSGKTHSIDL